MSMVAVRAKLLKWGNSFGLRLSRQDVGRLHLRPGVEVEVKLDVAPSGFHVGRVRRYRLGGRAADEHDALFEAAAKGEAERPR